MENPEPTTACCDFWLKSGLSAASNKADITLAQQIGCHFEQSTDLGMRVSYLMQTVRITEAVVNFPDQRDNTGIFHNCSDLRADFANTVLGGFIHTYTKGAMVAKVYIQLLRSEAELCRTVGRSC